MITPSRAHTSEKSIVWIFKKVYVYITFIGLLVLDGKNRFPKNSNHFAEIHGNFYRQKILVIDVFFCICCVAHKIEVRFGSIFFRFKQFELVQNKGK